MQDACEVIPHPLGVRPLGDRLLGDAPNLRDGLGALLRILADETLLQVLSHLTPEALSSCACTCAALRVLASTEDLWRACCLESLPATTRLRYHKGGWRRTYHAWQATTASSPSMRRAAAEAAAAAPAPIPACGARYYSDVLYTPWQCGTAAIPARWSRCETIPRVAACDLSVDEFEATFEKPGLPVIITGIVERWPAAEHWDEAALRETFGDDVGFHVGGHTMSLPDFFDYCASTTDEQPLYLFDKRFCETSAAAHGTSGAGGPSAASEQGFAADYRVPDYFAPSRDLFSHLLPPYRPDHRWLIVGATRSGSSWHVDPNATSAWNACVRGRKKWILTPPKRPPPGVTASADGAEVTSPISLYEWFRVFYTSLRASCKGSSSNAHGRAGATGKPVALEATVHAGEVLFVPSGWWHCCLNLEPSMAITQNYVPRSSAASVLRYLRAGDKGGDLVSGVPPEHRPKLAEKFEDVLRARCPEALEGVDAQAAPMVDLRTDVEQGHSAAQRDGDGSRAGSSTDVERPAQSPPAGIHQPSKPALNLHAAADFRFSF
jgi:hypothetical protein